MARNLSLSLNFSRDAPKMRVVPCAQAPSIANIGTKSGVGAAKTLNPDKFPGDTVTLFSSHFTSAPILYSSFVIALSP